MNFERRKIRNSGKVCSYILDAKSKILICESLAKKVEPQNIPMQEHTASHGFCWQCQEN
jgi:hypothetical protein